MNRRFVNGKSNQGHRMHVIIKRIPHSVKTIKLNQQKHNLIQKDEKFLKGFPETLKALMKSCEGKGVKLKIGVFQSATGVCEGKGWREVLEKGISEEKTVIFTTAKNRRIRYNVPGFKGRHFVTVKNSEDVVLGI